MKLRFMLAAILVMSAQLVTAVAQVEIDTLDLVLAGDPPIVIASMTDQMEVDLLYFQNQQFSIIAYLSGPATSVDWRLQNPTANVDVNRTDRTDGAWTLCSETLLMGMVVRPCSSLGYDGTYTLTVTPYNRSTTWSSTKLQFTIVNGTRGGGETNENDYSAECARGGRLVDTVHGELGFYYHYRCSNGATRVEFIGTHSVETEETTPLPPTPDNAADSVYSHKITVCKRGEPHIVEYDRSAPYNPVVVYMPVSAGTPGAFDHCVEYEDLLCDDDNVCVPAP